MKIKLGFSPCPNDTFIFDALVNHQFDTEGITYEPILEDVETLNRWALAEKLDVTKLSFPAFFKRNDIYELLNSGGAMGMGVGPLLIAKEDRYLTEAEVNDARIVLPGENTTANLLFSFAYPHAKNKTYKVFNEIEDLVWNRTFDMGVIIHENRFTYHKKGLLKVKDLGEHWEEKMRVPIPLGCIAAKKNLGADLLNTINEHIRHSLSIAFINYPHISNYVKQHAQAMSEAVMREHIDLYVNDYSYDLKKKGLDAIDTLHKVYETATNI